MPPLHPVVMESAPLIWALVVVMAAAACLIAYQVFWGRSK